VRAASAYPCKAPEAKEVSWSEAILTHGPSGIRKGIVIGFN